MWRLSLGLKVSRPPGATLVPGRAEVVCPISIPKVGLVFSLEPMSRIAPEVPPLAVHLPVLKLATVL